VEAGADVRARVLVEAEVVPQVAVGTGVDVTAVPSPTPALILGLDRVRTRIAARDFPFAEGTTSAAFSVAVEASV